MQKLHQILVHFLAAFLTIEMEENEIFSQNVGSRSVECQNLIFWPLFKTQTVFCNFYKNPVFVCFCLLWGSGISAIASEPLVGPQSWGHIISSYVFSGFEPPKIDPEALLSGFGLNFLFCPCEFEHISQ